jgi:hypothetical protein
MSVLLEELLGHLTRLPIEFLDQPASGGGDGIATAALVADLVAMLSGTHPSSDALEPFTMAYREAALARRLRLVQVACHLLTHPEFRVPTAGPLALRWLSEEMGTLAEAAAANYYVESPDGREELVRFALRAFGLRPCGETQAVFDDRLQAVSTVERARLLAASRAARERAKKLQKEAEARERAVRAELERKAAEEAAAKPSRE